jgi:superfamily II DNA or RNA helicase
MVRANDRVIRTISGEVGTVKAVLDEFARVRFPSGTTTLPISELEPAPDPPEERLRSGRLASSTAYGLRLQALYLRHAYKYDPLAGLSNARVEPMFHQIYVAHRVVSKLRPRMILADEVGLGKTIEAGIIIKELIARDLVERVLIVVPASLQHQWRYELSSKFNEDFIIMDGPTARFLGRDGGNPWGQQLRVICSLTLAGNPAHAPRITEVPWDMVIFDEAHHVRRTLQGGSKVQTTRAYDLADELKETANGLLLLTATPMQLSTFELYSMIELVEPGLFRSYEDYEQRRRSLPPLNGLMRDLIGWQTLSSGDRARLIDTHGQLISDLLQLGPLGLSHGLLNSPERREELMQRLVAAHPLVEVMTRNRKAEVGGFTVREPYRIPVELAADEIAAYEAVSEYIRNGYEAARRSKRNAVGFLMVMYQKMLASSSTAIRASFLNRIEKLRARRDEIREQRKAQDLPTDERIQELSEAEEASVAVDELEQLAIDEGYLEAEIAELETLVTQLGKLRDSKAKALLRAVIDILTSRPDEKVLIFTQYKQTQQFLARSLELNGISTAIFNGDLNSEEKERAVRRFQLDVPVLVSTEAGGEGRNFQFCHLMVNYDLPWNPMKVEQRIGRLDRIGQKRPVFIYNLASSGTIEERVLEVLDERIHMFTESVGSLDPILGEVEHDIANIVLEQVGRFDEAFADLGVRLEAKVRQAREQEKVLADFILDRASFRRDVVNELLEQKPLAGHEDLRRFCETALPYFGGYLSVDKDGVAISLSPKLAARLKTRATVIRGAFDPKVALGREDDPFLAIGHELIDGLIALPLDEEAATGVRRAAGAPPGVSLEVFYAVEADGFYRFGQLVRHVVGENLSLSSEIVTSMPDLGPEVDRVILPDWWEIAADHSAQAFHAEYVRMSAEISEKHRERQREEIERAGRIFGYRQRRLDDRIGRALEWISEVESTGTEGQRRVLPARRGQLGKDRERLSRLTAEHEEQVRLIESKTAGDQSRIVAMGLVVGE